MCIRDRYGSDQRPNTGGQYGNADAMVLLSIDTKHKKLKMTSFMRDLWVMVPGKREYRINTAYLLGGPRLSIETVEKNFGIKIDKYAVVDFQTFPQIIDTLGGITIDITQPEADYLNALRPVSYTHLYFLPFFFWTSPVPPKSKSKSKPSKPSPSDRINSTTMTCLLYTSRCV